MASSAKTLEANTFIDVILPNFKCPECDGPVQIAIQAWDPETGEPHEWSVQCANDDDADDDSCDGDQCDECGGSGWHGFDESEQEVNCDLCGGSGVITGHRYYQSDWQEIIDRAEAWGKAQKFRVPCDQR